MDISLLTEILKNKHYCQNDSSGFTVYGTLVDPQDFFLYW